MIVATIIPRQDTAANFTLANTLLGFGEVAVETDTGKRKIGDGVTAWNDLKYDGDGIISITYSELVTLAGNNGLTIGQRYRITDYRTERVVVYDSHYNYTGTPEVLIVVAKSTNQLEKSVLSETYHNDLMLYELVDSSGMGFQKGRIIERYDVKMNIKTKCDFRNYWSPLIEGVHAPQGTFYLPYNGDGNPTLFPMFDFQQNIRNVNVGMHLTSHIPVVFQGSVEKVTIGVAGDAFVFVNRCSDVTIGSCSAMVAIPEIGAVHTGNNIGVNFLGDPSLYGISGVDIGSGVQLSGSGTDDGITGKLQNCVIMPGYTNNGTYVLAGDYVNQAIGYP